jgi:hypothetical protein
MPMREAERESRSQRKGWRPRELDSTPGQARRRPRASGEADSEPTTWEMGNPWGEPSQLGAEQCRGQPSRLGRLAAELRGVARGALGGGRAIWHQSKMGGRPSQLGFGIFGGGPTKNAERKKHLNTQTFHKTTMSIFDLQKTTKTTPKTTTTKKTNGHRSSRIYCHVASHMVIDPLGSIDMLLATWY